MLRNLCVDVQPMLCIVQLLPGQVFDENLKEGYSYFTIGGNHSRAALQVSLQSMIFMFGLVLGMHQYMVCIQSLVSDATYNYDQSFVFNKVEAC